MSFEVDIHCDGCGETIYICHHDRVVTKGLMIRKARKHGWSIGKYHLCPECRKKRNKLKAEGWLT